MYDWELDVQYSWVSCIYRVEEADLLVNAIDPIIVDGFVTISILGFKKKNKRKGGSVPDLKGDSSFQADLTWEMKQLNGCEVLGETNKREIFLKNLQFGGSSNTVSQIQLN